MFSTPLRLASFLAVSALLFGCGDDDSPPPADAAVRDTGPGPVDSGPPDAGTPPTDTGTPPVDTGIPTDTGTPPADAPVDGPSPFDAGPPGPDAGCATDPSAACDFYDIGAPMTAIDIHGAVRIALTPSAPTIVSAVMTLTVADDEGTETTVMFDAAALPAMVLRGDAGPVSPLSATRWTRLEIAIVDPCGTEPAPRAIFVFVREADGRIEATCTTS